MKTPRLWRHLVGVCAPPEDRYAILSDLEEEFDRIVSTSGARAARRWYGGQAIRSALPLLRLRARAIARAARDATEGPHFFGLGRDVRTAIGVHARAPIVTFVVIVSLAVGVGATTTVFSLARSFVFPSSGGMTDTAGFVTLYTSDEDGEPYGTTSFPDFLDIAESVDGLERLAATRLGIVRSGEDSRRLIVELTTEEYFTLLGVPMALGRSFTPEEARIGSAHRVAVISHAHWTERLGGSPSVLGQTLRLDGEPFTIIGVAPDGLRSRLLQLKVDAWLPLGIPGGTYHATPQELANRRDREYMVMARLAPGITRSEVEERLEVLAEGLASAYPDAWTDDRGMSRSFQLLDEKDSRLPPMMRTVTGLLSLFLLGGTGLILVVACSNVAGLLLARAHARAPEMSVRVSLGASRGRIVRMLLVESLVLAGLGGGLGVGLTAWASGRLSSVPLPGDLPALTFDLGVDALVLTFALGVATLSALVFGLAPALEASRAGALRPGSGALRGGPRRSTLRRRLVGVQVAGSVVFVAASALAFRVVDSLEGFEPGLNTARLAIVSRSVPEDFGDGDPTVFLEEEADAALADPRIDRIAIASVAEGTPFFDLTRARIDIPGQGEPRDAVYAAVTPEYAELVGHRTVEGRGLSTGDTRGSSPVAVVNETFARRYWPGRPAVGQRFTVLERRQLSTPEDTVPVQVEVVGVHADAGNNPGSDDPPFFWVSLDQFPVRMAVLIASGPSGPGAAAAAFEQSLPSRAGEISLVGPAPHSDVASLATLGSRVTARILAAAGGFVLGLALVGLAGLISFTVTLRLPELALRKALGADPRGVVQGVVKDSLKLVAQGTVGGFAILAPIAYATRDELAGVSPIDPVSLGVTLLLMALAAVVTSLLPALRAGRADPVRYLRGD